MTLRMPAFGPLIFPRFLPGLDRSERDGVEIEEGARMRGVNGTWWIGLGLGFLVISHGYRRSYVVEQGQDDGSEAQRRPTHDKG